MVVKMASRRGGNCCAAINCSITTYNSQQISLFRFPKDAERCKKWRINTRRSDLDCKSVEILNSNFRLCSRHFEDSQFMNAKHDKLVWNAVPTLFDVPNKPSPVTRKRRNVIQSECKPVANCRTANLKQKTCAELTANYLVCGKHSEDRMFMNSGTRSSLVHNAVPTLFNFPHQSSSPAKAFRKRKLPTVDELHMHSPPPESDKNSESVVLISEEKSQTENQAKVNEDICMSTTISSLQPERLPTLLSHNVKAIPVVKAPQKSLPTSRVSPSHLKTSSFASAKNSQPTSQNVPKCSVGGSSCYREQLSSKLESFRQNEFFCDTVLVIGQQSLKVHGIILAAASPFFKTALELHSRPGLCYLTLYGYDFDIVESVVQFFYTGSFESIEKFAKSSKRAELSKLLRDLGCNLETFCSEGETLSDSQDLIKLEEFQKTEQVPSAEQLSVEQNSLLAGNCHLEPKLNIPVEGRDSQINIFLLGSTSAASQLQNMNAQNVLLLSTFSPHGQNRLVDIQIALLNRKMKAQLHLGSNKDLKITRKSAFKRVRKCKSSTVSNTMKADLVQKNIPAKKKNLGEKLPKTACRVKTTCTFEIPKHVCQTCDKKFGTIIRFQEHLRLHVDPKPYMCEYCGKMFSDVSVMRKHLCSHTGEKNFFCNECGRGFIQKNHLDDHLVSIHTNERKYLCTVCGKRFKTNSCLFLHTRCHEPGPVIYKRKRTVRVRPFEQSQCNKHAECDSVSTKDKSVTFSCKVCKKVYAFRGCLAAHSKLHSAKKSFLCCICSKSFRWKRQLELHKRVHTDEKPFACTTCNKRFKNCISVRRHNMEHRGERPHKCDICGSAFALKSSLTTHLRTHAEKTVNVTKRTEKQLI